MKEKLDVIIVAAGKGNRFNTKLPKPFIKINNKPMIWYPVFSFYKLDFIRKIYIVVSKNFISYCTKLIKKYFKNNNDKIVIVEGGEERYNSVFNALKKIEFNGGCDYVAVHDAARPFIKADIIINTFKMALQYGAASPGVTPVNTIKICNNEGMIITHPKRSDLVEIQTPQIFLFKNIMLSYKKSKDLSIFTDDTEVYANHYKNIKIIYGDNDLLKITFKNDLNLAKMILRKNKLLWK